MPAFVLLPYVMLRAWLRLPAPVADAVQGVSGDPV